MKSWLTPIFILLITAAAGTFIIQRNSKNKNPMTDLLIKKENFDTVVNGKKVSLFTLQNKNGISVQVTNYGAYLISVIAPGKNGNYGDVIAGYDNIVSLMKDNMFMGCVVDLSPTGSQAVNSYLTENNINYSPAIRKIVSIISIFTGSNYRNQLSSVIRDLY
jgi:hypothetical protein